MCSWMDTLPFIDKLNKIFFKKHLWAKDFFMYKASTLFQILKAAFSLEISLKIEPLRLELKYCAPSSRPIFSSLQIQSLMPPKIFLFWCWFKTLMDKKSPHLHLPQWKITTNGEFSNFWLYKWHCREPIKDLIPLIVF